MLSWKKRRSWGRNFPLVRDTNLLDEVSGNSRVEGVKVGNEGRNHREIGPLSIWRNVGVVMGLAIDRKLDSRKE